MSLRTRLLATFGLVTGVMLVPSLFAVSGLSQLREIAVEGRAGHAAVVTRLGQMQAMVIDLDRLERSFIVTGNPALGAAAVARADSLNRVHEEFRASPYGSVGSTLGPLIEEITRLTVDVHDLVRAGRREEATDRFENALGHLAAAKREYRTVADSVDALARADLRRADAMGALARDRTLAGLGLALLLALVFTGLTTQRLTDPLRRLGRATARVADGAFEVPEDLPYERTDEIGDLADSFAIMTRRLAELNRTKSEFLGMVSHELKTPINVIAAYMEMLREDLDDVSEHHANMIRDVDDQARGMARLVSRLMDLSRLEAGTYQLQCDAVGVEHLLAELASTFRRLADDKGITVETKLSETAPSEVVLDADIVRDEVLGNLMLNAIRHTPEGGRIEVSADGDAKGIQFVVADSGPGIPPQHRDLIFRKHYVADRTKAVGSGLGLAIAKEMVELHGGLITLEDTEPSCGARIRVALPIMPATVDVEVPASSLLRGPGSSERRSVA